MEGSLGLFLLFVIGMFGQVAFWVDIWKGTLPFWVGFSLQFFPFVFSYFGLSLLEESNDLSWAWWGGRLSEWGLGAYALISISAIFAGGLGFWRPHGWIMYLVMMGLGILPCALFWRGLRGWRQQLLLRTKMLSPSPIQPIQAQGTAPSEDAAASEDPEELEGMEEASALGELFEINLGIPSFARTPEQRVLTWKERWGTIGWDGPILGGILLIFLALTVFIHIVGAWDQRPSLLLASYAMWGGGGAIYFWQAIEGMFPSYIAPSPQHARLRRLRFAWFSLGLGVVGVWLIWMAWQDTSSSSEERWILAGIGVFYALALLGALNLFRRGVGISYEAVQEGLVEQHPEGALLWPWERFSWSSWWIEPAQREGYTLRVGLAFPALERACEKSEFSDALWVSLGELSWVVSQKGTDIKREACKKQMMERVHRRLLVAAKTADEAGDAYYSSECLVIGGEEAFPNLASIAEHIADGKATSEEAKRQVASKKSWSAWVQVDD
ncbi:MAG: hypothetical protein H6728_02585 [Myxococcales bacterium]|nr:hypothetical protein [Myxococcales bacterium]